MIAILTALMLGVLHALEVDHMIAVTTFVAGRPALGPAARFGLRWGLGHSVAVLLFGGGLLLTGVRWPTRYDAVGEGLVGLMLIGLGVWALRSSRKLHLHPPAEHGDHAHLHVHGSAAPDPAAGGHAHAHPHPHPQHHHHGHGVTLVGLMHGLAGSSAVVALVPVTLIQRWQVGLGYLAAFGVGVTAGMMLYASVASIAMARAASGSLLWARRITGLVGGAGIAVGLWWVGRAVLG